MFRKRKQLDTLVVIALHDLSQRLKALEKTGEDESAEADPLDVMLNVQAQVHSLYYRLENIERVESELVRALGSLTGSVQEVKENTDSSRYYQQRSGQQVDKLAAKIDRLVERQGTTEQLLDAIRVYAAERTVRDEQAAQPDGTENGDSV